MWQLMIASSEFNKRSPVDFVLADDPLILRIELVFYLEVEIVQQYFQRLPDCLELTHRWRHIIFIEVQIELDLREVNDNGHFVLIVEEVRLGFVRVFVLAIVVVFVLPLFYYFNGAGDMLCVVQYYLRIEDVVLDSVWVPSDSFASAEAFLFENIHVYFFDHGGDVVFVLVFLVGLVFEKVESSVQIGVWLVLASVFILIH